VSVSRELESKVVSTFPTGACEVTEPSDAADPLVRADPDVLDSVEVDADDENTPDAAAIAMPMMISIKTAAPM
jgi:hypothetical protein